jgi:hypothetical protein
MWWPEETARKLNRKQGGLPPLRGLVNDLSFRKIARLTLVLAMSFACWLGVGCFAIEVLQLAAH